MQIIYKICISCFLSWPNCMWMCRIAGGTDNVSNKTNYAYNQKICKSNENMQKKYANPNKNNHLNMQIIELYAFKICIFKENMHFILFLRKSVKKRCKKRCKSLSLFRVPKSKPSVELHGADWEGTPPKFDVFCRILGLRPRIG